MGIYSYELFKYYDVEKIIRIGSCGAYLPELKLFDIILSNQAYNEGNFALTLNNERCHLISASKELNKKIQEAANKIDVKIHIGSTVCSEVFDAYMTDNALFLNRIPGGINPIASEMEAFALFYTAKLLNKQAACLMTVVDSKYIKEKATPEEREKNLRKMIELALNSIKEGE